MARPDKAAAVAELTAAFRGSTAAVLTEYRGLSVAELKELRRALAGNATYNVVKNTLTKIAAKDAGVESFDSLLEGPSAIAFVSGDPVEVAKGLRNFGREHPRLVVKGGVLDGKPLSADEIRRLADLESREVLLARFAGGMLAPAQQLASVLAAPVAELARLLGALEAKIAADPSAHDETTDAPAAADSATDAAPPAESSDDAAADSSGEDVVELAETAVGETRLPDETETAGTEAAGTETAGTETDNADPAADDAAAADTTDDETGGASDAPAAD